MQTAVLAVFLVCTVPKVHSKSVKHMSLWLASGEWGLGQLSALPAVVWRP